MSEGAKNCLGAGIIAVVFFAAGLFLGASSAPNLIKSSLGVIAGDGGIRASIHQYEVTNKSLKAQAVAAHARADEWRDAAVDTTAALYKARERVALLEKAKPDIKQRIVESVNLVSRPVPVPCEVYVEQINVLTADLRWSNQYIESRNVELIAASRLVVVRNLEIKDLRVALTFQTKRADDGEDVIRKVKKHGVRSKVIGVAAIVGAVVLSRSL